jgi:hypothetical protein
MSTGVFVIRKDGSLVEMKPSDYDSEDVLQELLAKYPNLLAGNLIDDINPRKWLLISREYGIPDKNDSYDRWSLDHLFLDQDGIPTLVEVKQSSDTRIRRAVVGQMLEYAANAVQYWDTSRIIASYEARCNENELNPQQELIQTLELEESYEEFWNKVKTNLEISKIRLLFIADEIPLELRQIVEFLNEQMNNVEVLAIEIKQYTGPEQKTLIPRLFGQSTKTSVRKRGNAEKRQWDEESLLKDMKEKEGANTANIASDIISWAKERKLDFWYGKGKITGSCFPIFKYEGQTYWVFAIWSNGRLEYQFKFMKGKPPFNDNLEGIQCIIDKLNAIEGISLPPDTVERMPSTHLSVFENKEKLCQFFEIWEEYMKNIEEGNF